MSCHVMSCHVPTCPRMLASFLTSSWPALLRSLVARASLTSLVCFRRFGDSFREWTSPVLSPTGGTRYTLPRVCHVLLIPTNYDGMCGVERHVIESAPPLGHDTLHTECHVSRVMTSYVPCLDADGLVPVPRHVEHVHLPVQRHHGEGGAGVGRPGHVAHRRTHVEGVERLGAGGAVSRVTCPASPCCSSCPRS